MKEGFLLYYPESENKVFERAHTFNIHPKVYNYTTTGDRKLYFDWEQFFPPVYPLMICSIEKLVVPPDKSCHPSSYILG